MTDGTKGLLTEYWIVSTLDANSGRPPGTSIGIHSKYRADDYNGDWDMTNAASLHFRCTPPADLEVFVVWQNPVQVEDDETVKVLLRLDNSEILTRRWTTSTSGDITFYGNRMQSLIGSLDTITRFRARTETPDGTLLTADFDVSRFKELAPKVINDCLS